MSKTFSYLFLTIALSVIPLNGYSVIIHSPIKSYLDTIRDIDKAIEYLKDDPEKAILYSKRSLEAAYRDKDSSLIAHSQIIIAEAYVNRGDFVKGYDLYTRALTNCPSADLWLKAKIHTGLSGSYLVLRDFKTAFENINYALKIFKELNDSANIATSYNIMGLIYVQVPDCEKADELFRKSLDINRQINDRERIAANLNNLSLYRGDTNEKIKFLEEAIEINALLGKKWALGENYNNLGVQYYYAKNYNKSLEALKIAKSYAESVGAKELILDNLRYYTWVYGAIGEYKKGYETLSILFKEYEQRGTSEGIRGIEIDILGQKLSISEKEKELQKEKTKIIRMQSILVIIILVLGVATVASFYFSYRSKHKKKIAYLEAIRRIELQEKDKIEKELRYSRDELTNLAFYIKSKNELIQNIQERIKSLYQLPEKEVHIQLRGINLFVSKFTSHNDEYEALIDKLNVEFLAKLTALHPELTKNEKRIASMLRVDFSTKDISSIMNTEPKSVDMARYRLRKKLQLESDKNLNEYLQKI